MNKRNIGFKSKVKRGIGNTGFFSGFFCTFFPVVFMGDPNFSGH